MGEGEFEKKNTQRVFENTKAGGSEKKEKLADRVESASRRSSLRGAPAKVQRRELHREVWLRFLKQGRTL